jgi:hypothetical protein
MPRVPLFPLPPLPALPGLPPLPALPGLPPLPALPPLLVALAALTVLAACGSDAGTRTDDRETTDLEVQVPEWTGVVGLEIGRSGGPDPYLLGQIAGIEVDAEGRVYVSDGQAHEIRVFSADGEFLHAAGGAGAGPGELSRPCCLALDLEGYLWVRDTGNGRYNRYRPEPGALVFTGQRGMAHGDANFGARTTFGPDGLLVDVGHRADPATGRRPMVRHHTDAAGAVVREEAIATPGLEELGAFTVERGTPEERSTFFFYPPFGPSHLVAHGPGGGWAEALGSTYEVRWFGPGGEARPTIRVPGAQGAPVGEAERAAAEERTREQLQGVGANPMEARFRTPDRKPPLVGLYLDAEGRLWVQRSVTGGEPSRAEIFGTDGRLEARASWPAGVSFLYGVLRGEEAWGTGRNADGAPVVVRIDWVAR